MDIAFKTVDGIGLRYIFVSVAARGAARVIYDAFLVA
jgi:hypothetical protein